MIEICHQMPGRVRLRLPALRRDSAQADWLARLLAAQPGIGSVRANPACGSLVVHYEPARLALPVLIGWLERRLLTGAATTGLLPDPLLCARGLPAPPVAALEAGIPTRRWWVMPVWISALARWWSPRSARRARPEGAAVPTSPPARQRSVGPGSPRDRWRSRGAWQVDRRAGLAGWHQSPPSLPPSRLDRLQQEMATRTLRAALRCWWYDLRYGAPRRGRPAV